MVWTRVSSTPCSMAMHRKSPQPQHRSVCSPCCAAAGRLLAGRHVASRARPAAHLDVRGNLARARARHVGVADDVGPRELEVEDGVGRVAGAPLVRVRVRVRVGVGVGVRVWVGVRFRVRVRVRYRRCSRCGAAARRRPWAARRAGRPRPRRRRRWRRA